ncbi:MAG: hypothetical protein ABIT76_13685 [Chthoniobacterales bacterium]
MLRFPFLLGASLLFGIACSFAEGKTASVFTEEEFIRLSTAVDPKLAFAAHISEEDLEVAVDVERFGTDGKQPMAEVVVGAGKNLRQDNSQANIVSLGNVLRMVFRFPREALHLPPDAAGFRMALRVIWPGKNPSTPRLIQRYRDGGPGAGFDPLSTDASHWEFFDLAGHQEAVAATQNEIAIEFEQPAAGLMSLVIETPEGKRVRSLVSALKLPVGMRRLVWDGLDDSGTPVLSGIYRWKAISHAGIHPKYLFSYYNEGKPPFGLDDPKGSWGGDHSNPTAAAAFGEDVYLGWPLAEAGFNIVRTDLQGAKQSHIRIPPHVSSGKLMLAAAADRVFAAVEGRPGYTPFVLRPDGTWSCPRPLNILAWTKEGKSLSYGGPKGEREVAVNPFEGSGTVPFWVPPADNLAGFAAIGESLFVSLKKENRIVILDARTAKQTREIQLPNPGLLAAGPDGNLMAFSGDRLGMLEVKGGIFHPLSTPAVAAPRGMTVSPRGEILISDNGPDQDIKVMSARGELLRTLGRKGGRPSLGKWQSNGVYQPFGIATDKEGKLWVTEDDRTPRRISVWDVASGQLVKELFGPTDYGAPGGSFDPDDATHWIGAGVLWSLDFAAKTARPLSTLYRPKSGAALIRRSDDYRLEFVREGGRTFVFGQSKQISLFELMDDQTLKPLALLGQLTGMANFFRWTLPRSIAEVTEVKAALVDAARELREKPEEIFQPSPRNPDWIEVPQKVLQKADIHFLWKDINGDGLPENEEFEFLPKETRWAFGSWGSGQSGLSMKVLVESPSGTRLLRLKPHGFFPSGTPDYRLAEALKESVEAPSFANLQATATDSQGRLLINAEPITALNAQGNLDWTLPGKWAGVQGSHKAPLPKSGDLQAALFFLGVAPLDKEGDVTVLNGNYGRDMILTTDGIYLDEFFSDIRMSVETGPYRTEGEPFGGYFGRSRKDGKYYLQSGKPDYRLFEMEGLDTLRRSRGEITVSDAQATAARSHARKEAEIAPSPKTLTVTDIPAGLTQDPDSWGGEWQAEWGERGAEYPYARVKLARQGKRLLIAWKVKDPSPWINRGADDKQLFKTGDAVAFEFSTDASAPVGRKRPTRGDRRLLIAPFGKKTIAVLYDYQNPDGKDPVLFSSPWRTEKIDAVRQVTEASVTVTQGKGEYTVVADIPANALGLPGTGQSETLAGDFGVIYGDAAGSVDLLRSYWSNHETGLVNDVPGEATIQPANWGTLIFP